MMNKRIIKTLFITVVFLTVIPVVYSQEKWKPVQDSLSFVQAFTQYNAKVKSIHSPFTQKKSMEFLEQEIESKGQFYFKKPDKLRWEYLSPFKYSIIIEGELVHFIEEDKSNSINIGSNQVFKEVSSIISGLVSGEILNKKGKFKADYFCNDDFYMVELIPFEGHLSKYIQLIRLYLGKEDYLVRKLIMNESSGDRTVLLFESPIANEAIPDTIFSLN